jgi:hypothetical protein
MGQPKKLIEQPELVHHLESRGMDGIAAKIAQEVRMLFEHQHFDARPREEVSQHHARWPTAGNAAPDGDLLRRHF